MNALSGVQKYLLRVIFGWAGKTILYRERVVEVIETHGSLRNCCRWWNPICRKATLIRFGFQDARVTASDSTLSVGTRADAIGRLALFGETQDQHMPDAKRCAVCFRRLVICTILSQIGV